MSQAHKIALNKYLTSRPANEVMYSNETFMAYRSGMGNNGVYRHTDGSITIKAPIMLHAGLLGVGGQDALGFDKSSGVPVFKAMELKLPGDRLKDKQIAWYNILKNHGCIAEVLLYKDGKFTPIDVDKQGTRVIR